MESTKARQADAAQLARFADMFSAMCFQCCAISTESGVLEQTPYSFTTRFESGKGTNPEELVAAAHAGCFTMALSAELGKANLVVKSLRTTATREGKVRRGS